VDRVVSRSGLAVLSVLAALIGGAAFAYFTNWSVLEPHSYYQVHRWGFGQVAELVDRVNQIHQGSTGGPQPHRIPQVRSL
jgi:uncharacterized protein (DUF885 family)